MANTRSKTHAKPKNRNPSRRERNDRLHSELVCARAALMTAILSTQGKGVFDDVSNSLRRHVLLPLEQAIAEAR